MLKKKKLLKNKIICVKITVVMIYMITINYFKRKLNIIKLIIVYDYEIRFKKYILGGKNMGINRPHFSLFLIDMNTSRYS